jgi:hypothetical protein
MNKAVLLNFTLVLSALFSVTSNAITLAELENDVEIENGFVDILYDSKEGRTYLKIDNLNQEFIYQTSLPSGLGSNDVGLDRGQLGDTSLVVFERAGAKLFLKQKPTRYRADTKNLNEAQAIDEAFASSVLWGFAIEDSGKNEHAEWVLVDASEFLLQDIHGVGRTLSEQKQGKGYSVDSSRSAVDLSHTKSFPDNTELQATITLVGTEPGNFVKETAPNPYAVTLKMRHSFVRLPDDDYQARPYIAKSGYWGVRYRDYAQPINENIERNVIGRHRLNKKDPTAVFSEAVKPIIYYVDPGAPEPVLSALIDGASWWSEGFESIGYKNAFQVKMLPDGADPMDVRYNVIQWVHRSTRGWSYGSSVTDPRTGEIIKGHVTLGSLRVRQDYLIAQGMMAPFADDENDQALMDLALARIRQLSAHEVGHTIGIAHNFAASNYGRESVMDYPHPQFELASGDANKIVAPNAYAVGLGKWDKAVIAYGYSEFAESQDELTQLKAMIKENDENGLLYLSDPDSRSVGDAHAYASLWDNGADAVAELKQMMLIREVALNNFGVSNLKHGRNWSDLEEILVPVYYFHRFQIQAAAKWLGGVNYEYSTKGENGNSTGSQLQVISGKKQRMALDLMLETLSPKFLEIRPELTKLLLPKAVGSSRTRESVNGQTGVTFDRFRLASASAQHTLNAIFHPKRLARLSQQNAADSTVPSIADLGDALHESVIKQAYSGTQARLHQSVVNLIYSNYLNLLNSTAISNVVKAEILAIIEKEKRALSRKRSRSGDSDGYQSFYQFQLQRLNHAKPSQSDEKINLPMMPPGSPI